jgi:multidrug efflux pump
VKGEYVVTSINANTELKSAEAFAAPLKVEGDSRVLLGMWRGSRWARKTTTASARSVARLGVHRHQGHPGANPLDVIKEVRKIMPELEAQLPPTSRCRLPTTPHCSSRPRSMK